MRVVRTSRIYCVIYRLFRLVRLSCEAKVIKWDALNTALFHFFQSKKEELKITIHNSIPF